jgi:hypothetical protein
MRVPKSWVPIIARKIVDKLVGDGYIEPKVPAKHLTPAVEGLIMDELMVEDRLNEEVRGILRKHESEIDRGRLDYRRLFEITKQKLVKERNLIL